MHYSIAFSNPNLKSQAELLAKDLNLALNNEADICLWLSEQGLGLKLKNTNPIFADFSLAHWQKRHDEGRKQGLVRAVKPTKGMRIIDASAGWGRDAAILASFGAEVLMIERNPIMATILADALVRQDEQSRVNLKLSLQFTDALTYLETLTPEEYPDVIYIDPMHPARQKSALVKKDLQLLQQMIGEDQDAKDLLELATQRVKQKVVVKWPQKLTSLLPTSSCISGKTIRFDCYKASLSVLKYDL